MLNKFSVFSFSVLGIKCRALHMLGKGSTAGLHTQPDSRWKNMFQCTRFNDTFEKQLHALKNMCLYHTLMVITFGWEHLGDSNLLAYILCIFQIPHKSIHRLYKQKAHLIMYNDFHNWIPEDILHITHPRLLLKPAGQHGTFRVAAHVEGLTHYQAPPWVSFTCFFPF